ncbi:MAG TPA: shikimate dehydrogenase [Actinomycetota bacterium]|nr:shikimate dehydrogenase [Actinomycetota bacterium]
MAASLSPVIHNAAFRALELNWIYVPFPVLPGQVLSAIEGLARAGVRGLNVTTPHKTHAAGAATTMSAEAAQAKAVNTLVMDGDSIGADNTDGRGLIQFIEGDLGWSPRDKSVLILGTGGAARSAAVSLAGAGTSGVALVSRTSVGARTVTESLDLPSVKGQTGVSRDDLATADLVINATPVGAGGESLHLEMAGLKKGAVVVDLVYQRAVTPLLEEARRLGYEAHNGLGMLLHQAALSFEIWTAVRPPLELMSAAAVSHLARSG